MDIEKLVLDLFLTGSFSFYFTLLFQGGIEGFLLDLLRVK